MSEKNASSDEDCPFLDDTSSSHDQQLFDTRRRRSLVVPLAFHVVLILIYTSVFALFIPRLQSADCRRADVIASSATSAIEYGTRVFDEIDDLHRYFGKPTPQLEAEWADLLKYQWISAPEEDMRKLGRLEEGIRLPDGGYFATLGVYHDLHCLRRIHHAFYRAHYFPNLTAEEKMLDSLHAAHCLNSIRQSIQCLGDVSLLTMRWDDHQAEPVGNFTARHECVNWDRIRDWAREHTYDVMAEGVLVHPIFGPSYPDGKPSLGVGKTHID